MFTSVKSSFHDVQSLAYPLFFFSCINRYILSDKFFFRNKCSAGSLRTTDQESPRSPERPLAHTNRAEDNEEPTHTMNNCETNNLQHNSVSNDLERETSIRSTSVAKRARSDTVQKSIRKEEVSNKEKLFDSNDFDKIISLNRSVNY